MAKLPKSPQQKKHLSLVKDRRNGYGENDKSSRKNIPKSKALSHRKVRRQAKTLEVKWQSMAEATAESAELTSVTPRLQKGRFKKSPDVPLGEVVGGKLLRRRSPTLKSGS
jgi:hypothetical protein